MNFCHFLVFPLPLLFPLFLSWERTVARKKEHLTVDGESRKRTENRKAREESILICRGNYAAEIDYMYTHSIGLSIMGFPLEPSAASKHRCVLPIFFFGWEMKAKVGGKHTRRLREVKVVSRSAIKNVSRDAQPFLPRQARKKKGKSPFSTLTQTSKIALKGPTWRPFCLRFHC